MSDRFLRYVPAFRIAFAVTLVVVSYLAVTPAEHKLSHLVSDKLNHMAAFLVLAALLDFSFPREEFTLAKAGALLGYGLLIEIVQYFLPFRHFSMLDLAVDALGLAAYALLRPLCHRLPILRERWQGSATRSA
ncbi:VanZ family protein [Sulfuritalea sp.]|uniref:VanZ family protein n=1 Tax=Sulfuritalea sp. TaxID=2480090 RepID=UPI001AC034EE|nr:VanZ family protein [Sulfuritalea sp.]MBN8473875.1 VanZ family protein [Sulfuritalea sp.]